MDYQIVKCHKSYSFKMRQLQNTFFHADVMVRQRILNAKGCRCRLLYRICFKHETEILDTKEISFIY